MKGTSVVVVLLIATVLILPAVSGAISNSGEKTPIKHVINIYFENHTFDNFFGTYPKNPSSSDQSLIAYLILITCQKISALKFFSRTDRINLPIQQGKWPS